MRKLFIAIIANSIVLVPIILIYCWMVYENNLFNWILTSVTFINLMLCLIYWKEFKYYLKNSSIERFISFIGLEIALLAFIQTNYQFVKSNEQFEKNRIASEKLFEQQIDHSEKLNKLQIDNAKKLNQTLTDELIHLQDINIKLSKSAESQLLAAKSQLELSEQSLQDYLFDTKAELSIESTIISNTDTLENSKLQLAITSSIKNSGRREAENVEFRQMVIFKNQTITKLGIIEQTEFFTGDKSLSIHYYPIVPIEMADDFFYWVQMKYYDEKTGSIIDRSFYYRYYKSAKGFDFYYAKISDRKILRDVVDKELTKYNLSLTTN